MKKEKKILISIFATVLVVCLVIGCVMLIPPSKEKVLSKTIIYLGTGDYTIDANIPASITLSSKEDENTSLSIGGTGTIKMEK